MQIPLRVRFKHATQDRRTADAIWVEARGDDLIGLGEGCPRPYVTGERCEDSLAWIERLRRTLEAELTSLAALREFVDSHSAEIDAHPAAWCAVESAVLDHLARAAGCSVEALLGIPSSRSDFQYSAVVGEESGASFDRVFARYVRDGFRDFKLKVGADPEHDGARLHAFAASNAAAPLRLRLDANNAWATDFERAARELEALQALARFVAVEEPLAAREQEAQRALSERLGVPVILDESLCTLADLQRYAGTPGHWIANLKVSKSGGLLRSLVLIEHLREAGIPIVIGAQVGETSVLTRLGIVAARAADDVLWGQEGAFGTLLLEYDAAVPMLQFSEGGKLALGSAKLGPTGLGLEPANPVDAAVNPFPGTGASR